MTSVVGAECALLALGHRSWNLMGQVQGVPDRALNKVPSKCLSHCESPETKKVQKLAQGCGQVMTVPLASSLRPYSGAVAWSRGDREDTPEFPLEISH